MNHLETEFDAVYAGTLVPDRVVGDADDSDYVPLRVLFQRSAEIPEVAPGDDGNLRASGAVDQDSPGDPALSLGAEPRSSEARPGTGLQLVSDAGHDLIRFFWGGWSTTGFRMSFAASTRRATVALRQAQQVLGVVYRRAYQSALGYWEWLRAKRESQLASKRLRLCETVSLGEKRFLAIVTVDGQHFLVGGAPNSVSMLAPLAGQQDFAGLLRQREIG